MEPNDAASSGTSSSARAQELRASLGARREVEALPLEDSQRLLGAELEAGEEEAG